MQGLLLLSLPLSLTHSLYCWSQRESLSGSLSKCVWREERKRDTGIIRHRSRGSRGERIRKRRLCSRSRSCRCTDFIICSSPSFAGKSLKSEWKGMNAMDQLGMWVGDKRERERRKKRETSLCQVWLASKCMPGLLSLSLSLFPGLSVGFVVVSASLLSLIPKMATVFFRWQSMMSSRGYAEENTLLSCQPQQSGWGR